MLHKLLLLGLSWRKNPFHLTSDSLKHTIIGGGRGPRTAPPFQNWLIEFNSTQKRRIDKRYNCETVKYAQIVLIFFLVQSRKKFHRVYLVIGVGA